jgi:glutaredoxin-like protein NrdH
MVGEVIVYSTPLCAPCERLKAYLRARRVAYRVSDLLLDEAAAERLEALGIRSAPALEIDGRILAGRELEPARLDTLLGL